MKNGKRPGCRLRRKLANRLFGRFAVGRQGRVQVQNERKRGGNGISREIVTKDGDMLDALCWRHYRREDVVPDVLKANPALAGMPPMLPAGLLVVLPDLPEPAEKLEIRLWN